VSGDRTRRFRRPGRSSGTANLGIGVAVLAILVPLLLQAATAAPPSAAEFAPNSQHVIKQAPPGQGVTEGPGKPPPPTHPPSAGPTPTPSPSTLTVPENQVLKCVGPPPLRQIEDPQSPPCKAYWKGDNGGATAQGVTRDAVYIAIPTPESKQSNYEALKKFFNKRFQFYGRKLVFEYCNGTSNSGEGDQATQDADAATAAAGCAGDPKPFASQFYRQNNGRYYMEAMGCRYRVVTVGSYSPYDSTYMNQCAPYLYQYPMVVDQEFATIGDWTCARLVGRQATHAAGNDDSVPPKALNKQTRKFGIMLAPFTSDDPVATAKALRPITSRLHACGVDIPSRDIIINPVTALFDPSSAQNAVLQMKADNVTTILCECNFFSFGSLQRAADSSSYYPEWATSTFGLNDVNSSFILGQGPADQMQHTFGLTFQPQMTRPLLNPYNIALQEGDPSVGPDTTTLVEAELEIYRGLLLIASGIQMAGPHLTPATFRDGLRRTNFPNPITVTHAGFVGFPSDGYSMTDDAAEWWYSTTADGPFSDSSSHPGTVCYVEKGIRRTIGHFPHGGADPFFAGSCYSGA
jgi:hypothetical protein